MSSSVVEPGRDTSAVDPRSQRRLDLEVVGAALLSAAAIALWLQALSPIDVHRMNDLGLVSALPAAHYVAFALLSLGFASTLRRGRPSVALGIAQVLAQIVMLFGTASIVAELPRFATAWNTVGIADYVARTGAVDPTINAFFNWPAFFVLGAFFTQATGIPSALALVPPMPVIYNLLYLGPLVMILRSATEDRRLVLLGLWLYYLGNWVGQDYFAPQGFTYFLHLVVLAILLTAYKRVAESPGWLTWIGRRLPRSGWLGSPIQLLLAPEDPAQRQLRRSPVLVAVVAILIAAIVPAHQLTPYMTLVSVTALVVFGRTHLRLLPVYVGVLAVLWLRFGAWDYVSGHLDVLLGALGKLSTIFSQTVSSRVQGSPDHIVIARERLLFSFVIWAMALLGVVRRLRQGRSDLTYLLLFAAPFALLPLQPYGGEMLLRVFFFSLPFAALFSAALLAPTAGTTARGWHVIGLVLASMLLFGGFLLARYGNERMDSFTAQERAAVEYVQAAAPADSLLVSGTGNLPWRDTDYAKFDVAIMASESRFGSANFQPTPEQLAGLADWMASFKRPEAYLIVTRSDKARSDLLGELSSGALARLEQMAAKSDRFELVYHNEDASVFRLKAAGENASR